MFRVLAWLDRGRPDMVGAWNRRSSRVRLGDNNNGFEHADHWLRLLQRITGRADLGHLTTRAWDDLFPTRNFQKRNLEWCAPCLAKDPYHRLAWTLGPVRGCTEHHTNLQTRCARCGKTVPLLHERSAVCMCPHCGGDLRDPCTQVDTVDISDYDLWATDEVGKIIALAAEWHRPLQWNAAQVFTRLCAGAGIASAAEFGRAVGTSKITAWYWLNGKARPTLRFALHVCYRFGVSLASALVQPDRIATEADVRQPEFHLRPQRQAKIRNWPRIEEQLRTQLAVPLNAALPLSAAANLEGVAVRTLRVHFPVLCRAIATRHRRRMRSEREKRQRQLSRDIKGAIHRLHHAHVPFTPANIAGILQRPGLFCRHDARAALAALAGRARP